MQQLAYTSPAVGAVGEIPYTCLYNALKHIIYVKNTHTPNPEPLLVEAQAQVADINICSPQIQYAFSTK